MCAAVADPTVQGRGVSTPISAIRQKTCPTGLSKKEDKKSCNIDDSNSNTPSRATKIFPTGLQTIISHHGRVIHGSYSRASVLGVDWPKGQEPKPHTGRLFTTQAQPLQTRGQGMVTLALASTIVCASVWLLSHFQTCHSAVGNCELLQALTSPSAISDKGARPAKPTLQQWLCSKHNRPSG